MLSMHIYNLSFTLFYLRVMDCEQLKILQWNYHSLRNKIPELREIIDKCDIIALSTPWLKGKYQIRIPNFNILRRDIVNGQHGRVALLVKNNILFKVKEFNHKENSIESIAISIPIKSSSSKIADLLVASVYRIPSQDTSISEWQILFDITKALAKKRRMVSENLFKNPNHENLAELKSIEKDAKKKLRQLKMAKFRKFTEKKLSANSDISEV